jgi:hypothetical protein
MMMKLPMKRNGQVLVGSVDPGDDAQWTWLIYMAGGNNLEGAGEEDLAEMQQVGSTAQVNVIVQFDTEHNKTTRYRVEKNRLRVEQEMPGVDCGDPKVLTDFIKWGSQRYPAKHYLVDVWNHGAGWENLPADYDYDSIRSAKPRVASSFLRVKRSLFRTTVQKIQEKSASEFRYEFSGTERQPGASARAIAIDVGSHDYLDNQELRDALLKGLPEGKKVDIFGCDACLMNMLEICYEMKETADFMVGSEETEPGAGWPYAFILEALTTNPSMSPADLAKTIVSQYNDWYQKNGNPVRDRAATQSALDISRLQPVADAVNELADALVKDLNNVAGNVSLARDKSQKFEYPEYVDLGDFVGQVIMRLPEDASVKEAAVRIRNALHPETGNGFVIENATWGINVRRASGVSIYFPHREDYAADYAELMFSKEGRWKGFLEAFFEV